MGTEPLRCPGNDPSGASYRARGYVLGSVYGSANDYSPCASHSPGRGVRSEPLRRTGNDPPCTGYSPSRGVRPEPLRHPGNDPPCTDDRTARRVRRSSRPPIGSANDRPACSYNDARSRVLDVVPCRTSNDAPGTRHRPSRSVRPEPLGSSCDYPTDASNDASRRVRHEVLGHTNDNAPSASNYARCSVCSEPLRRTGNSRRVRYRTSGDVLGSMHRRADNDTTSSNDCARCSVRAEPLRAARYNTTCACNRTGSCVRYRAEGSCRRTSNRTACRCDHAGRGVRAEALSSAYDNSTCAGNCAGGDMLGSVYRRTDDNATRTSDDTRGRVLNTVLSRGRDRTLGGDDCACIRMGDRSSNTNCRPCYRAGQAGDRSRVGVGDDAGGEVGANYPRASGRV